jgi:hypothetical protein
MLDLPTTAAGSFLDSGGAQANEEFLPREADAKTRFN